MTDTEKPEKYGKPEWYWRQCEERGKEAKAYRAREYPKKLRRDLVLLGKCFSISVLIILSGLYLFEKIPGPEWLNRIISMFTGLGGVGLLASGYVVVDIFKQHREHRWDQR
jgi:hypothetical protein